MARLEAQSKLLYYPTPPSVVELIASWFDADGGLVAQRVAQAGHGNAAVRRVDQGAGG